MTTSSNVLLQRFLTKPTPRSAQSIAERINHWADIANHPELHTGGDTSKSAISAKRKLALQSLTGLIARNPVIAEQVLRDREQEAA